MENNSINQTTNNMESMSNNQTTNNMENNSNNQTTNNMENNSNNQTTNNMETLSNQTTNIMETKSHKSKQFSSAHPGLIVYVVDQSGSMSEFYPEGGTKAKFAQLAVSSAINNIITANGAGETIKDRAFISIIGFGKSVQNIRSGKLSEFANNPYRIETVIKKQSDGNGGFVEVEEQYPVYFDPVADGLTPLAEALGNVKLLFQGFMEKYPESPYPVAMIVTDGMPRSEGVDDAVEEANAIAVANEIKAMGGLILPCHMGDGKNRCVLPNSDDQLNSKQAVFTSKIASKGKDLSQEQKDAARKMELGNITNETIIMAIDAGPTTLTDFLNFGSSGAMQDKMSN